MGRLCFSFEKGRYHCGLCNSIDNEEGDEEALLAVLLEEQGFSA